MKTEPQEVVFVVDDDETVRKSLGSLLRSAGLNVETFASAQEFLAEPRADAPGCLVLDVRLPGLSGLELQRRLAADGCAVPVVFITAHGDAASRAQALEAGAVECLLKPFSEEALLSAIRAGSGLPTTTSGNNERQNFRTAPQTG
jgi:FixJ family two-component response regulator